MVLLLHHEDDMGKELNSISPVLVMVSMLGGVFLSFGNLSLQWCTSVFGAPLTTVVALQASLTVVLGTSINYFLEPEKTASAEMLLGGVLVFLIAIALATRAHLLYCQREQMQQGGYSPKIELKEGGYTTIESKYAPSNHSNSKQQYMTTQDESIESSSHYEELYSNEPHNLYTVSPQFALVVAMLGGCSFGFFSPAFNIAVNNPFGWDGGAKLSVPVANLFFSFAFMLASVCGNIRLIYTPPSAGGLIPTSISDYLTEPFTERRLAFIAGLMCGLANVLQFQGGSIVGFATADLVQAYPLVSTVWDVMLFGEFSRPGCTITAYIISMYVMYLAGIGLMISSASV